MLCILNALHLKIQAVAHRYQNHLQLKIQTISLYVSTFSSLTTFVLLFIANILFAYGRYVDIRYVNIRYVDIRYVDIRYVDSRYVDCIRYANTHTHTLGHFRIHFVPNKS